MKRLLAQRMWWMVWLALTWSVVAEQRFPPPDFESGYHLPTTTVPPPRALTWAYVDVAVLLISLGLACYLVLKRRSRRGVWALSLFSLVYFGFYRKGCICAIGSVQNVALALGDRSYALPLTVATFFLAPVVVSLFAGRTFCAAVCPHGALQDLMLMKPVKVPGWLEQGLGILPYVYLGAGVLFAATGSAFIICRYDPFVPLFRLSGSMTMLTAGAGFLLAAMFVGRPYCRFACPYGALLRLAAAFSKWRVTITPDVCTQCRLCEESCPFGAIREPTAQPSDPKLLAADRTRLGWLLWLLPLLVLMGGWGGARLSVAASHLDPTVSLAEKFLGPPPPTPPTPTPESLALGRAERTGQALVTEAVSIRRRLEMGGWLVGGWIGAVAGCRLIGLSLRHQRRDYEPDRAACFGCARCYRSCPNERARLGWPPLESAHEA